MKLENKIKELKILFDAFEKPLYTERLQDYARDKYVQYYINKDVDILELERKYLNKKDDITL